ncbi:hypothetical protein [Slackia equolifaciens]|nr:hypothetical protein [Slackia equolifaciens]
MTSLLILGATTETVKLIERANDLGFETFVADPFPDSPGKQCATHPVDIDCFDIDGICGLMARYGIDGVLPGCADVLIPVYEEVCDRAGKHCYVNKEVVRVLNNKRGLKDALISVGLPVVEEYTREQVSSMDFDKFPVFVKPADNNSSKGMSVVYDHADFDAAHDKALSFSRSKTVLIEAYKECDDFNIGFFLQDGEVAVTFTADRFVNNEQKGVGSITAGMVYPSQYTTLYFETVHDKMLELFSHLGFRNGIASIQAFVEDGKIMFYDPALRITGGQEYILSSYFYGLDILESLINFAVSGSMGPSGLVRKCDHLFHGGHACNLAFSVKCGTIAHVEGMDYARSLPNVINVTQEHFGGDVISKAGTAQQNIARMHLVADSRSELSQLIDELQKRIVAFDEDGSNMMLAGMDPRVALGVTAS